MNHPIPPVSIPAGQAVAWSFPTSAVAFVNESPGRFATITANSGTCSIIGTGHPGETDGCSVTWSNYVAPSLPPGAVVKNVYSVSDVVGTLGCPNVTPFDTPSSGPVNGLYFKNVGNSLSVLSTLSLLAGMGASTGSDIYSIITFNPIAVAVYYELPKALPTAYVDLGYTTRYPS